MQRYKDLNGDSGVGGYEIGGDSIIVEFKNGTTYLYTNRSTGYTNIEKMKGLAERGRGLGTFINKYVRDNYQAKLK